MDLPKRSFIDAPAVRESVPLLIGLVGPSGSGKTYSALRLATGIQRVTGGDIYGIDTEARRALNYAEQFTFRHVPFSEPFGSLDYLVAIRHCVDKGAKILIIDSASHEHEGVGGCLDFQEKEMERLARGDLEKLDKIKMLAWQKPKAARRALLNGIVQLNASMIFCFRAKEKTKPIKQKGGKTEVVEMGFQPIAGDEFLYEMTLNCLLLPNAGGVPSWQSEYVGERAVMKLPKQFRDLFEQPEPLSEETGMRLAEWASGKGQSDLRNDYLAYAIDVIQASTDPAALTIWWNSDAQKQQRRTVRVSAEQLDDLKKRVIARVEALKAGAPATSEPAVGDLPSAGELFGGSK